MIQDLGPHEGPGPAGCGPSQAHQAGTGTGSLWQAPLAGQGPPFEIICPDARENYCGKNLFLQLPSIPTESGFMPLKT